MLKRLGAGVKPVGKVNPIGVIGDDLERFHQLIKAYEDSTPTEPVEIPEQLRDTLNPESMHAIAMLTDHAIANAFDQLLVITPDAWMSISTDERRVSMHGISCVPAFIDSAHVVAIIDEKGEWTNSETNAQSNATTGTRCAEQSVRFTPSENSSLLRHIADAERK